MFPLRSLHTVGKQFRKTMAMAMPQIENRSFSTSSVRPSAFRDPFFRDPFDLWLYDPFRPMRRMLRRASDPFAMLDHFFDDRWVPQVRDNAAKLGVDEKGNFTYSVDTSGYRPDELSVAMEGDEVVVRGEHKETVGDETVHRQFIRRVRIPEGFQTEGLKCELDDACRMCVTAPKAGADPTAERRSIPIEVKAKAIDEKK